MLYITKGLIATNGNHHKNDIHFCLPDILLAVLLLLNNSQFNFPTVRNPDRMGKPYSQADHIFRHINVTFPRKFSHFIYNVEHSNSLLNGYFLKTHRAKSIFVKTS